jgi:hypothetical protein
MKTIEFTKKEIENFNLYYEDDKVWNFNDIEDQRQIAFEIVKILNDKF